MRKSMRCAWGLSALAVAGPAPSRRRASVEGGWARQAAISRAAVGCPPAERAVATDMLGAPLAAALWLREASVSAFRAPFASRSLSDEARAFARVQTGDVFPVARDLDEATRFVLAATMAQHGLRATCGDARGIHWTRPGQTLEAVDWYSEEGPDAPRPPCSGHAPDALALLRCEYPPVLPPEERRRGGGTHQLPQVQLGVVPGASWTPGGRVCGEFGVGLCALQRAALKSGHVMPAGGERSGRPRLRQRAPSRTRTRRHLSVRSTDPRDAAQVDSCAASSFRAAHGAPTVGSRARAGGPRWASWHPVTPRVPVSNEPQTASERALF